VGGYTRNRPSYKNYKIGIHTYGFPRINCFYGDPKKYIEIGDYCSIGKNVTLFINENHSLDWVTTYPPQSLGIKDIRMYPKGKGKIIIKNDVWLAEGSTILSGVTIGDGAIIGANTLVTKDVPDYAIFCGNPGKVVKYRFNEDVIKRLLKIAWWDWPVEKIINHKHLLFSNNIEKFLGIAEKE